MAAHDYAYGTRLDSEGSGTAFGADALSVRILPEITPPLRGSPSVVANRHGSTLTGHQFYDSYDFILEIDLPWTTADGVYEARSNILKRVTYHRERVWLQRTAPHQGSVEIPIAILRAPRTSSPRNRLAIPCRTLEPFWRDTAVTHSAVSMAGGVTNGGDAPIGDGVLVFSGVNGTQTVQQVLYGDEISITADTTSNAVTVDIGAGTVTQSGSDLDGAISAETPWWMEIQPGANAFSIIGGGTVTFTGRDKWL